MCTQDDQGSSLWLHILTLLAKLLGILSFKNNIYAQMEPKGSEIQCDVAERELALDVGKREEVETASKGKAEEKAEPGEGAEKSISDVALIGESQCCCALEEGSFSTPCCCFCFCTM